MAEDKGKTLDDPISDLLKDPKKVDEKVENKEEDKVEDKKIEEKKVETPVNHEDFEKRMLRRDEVSDFVSSEEGKLFAPFASIIKKAASDPRFLDVPISQLPQIALNAAAYTKVLDEARKSANREAADSVIGGTTSKQLSEAVGQKDIRTLPKDDFQDLKNKALRGDFLIKR